MLSSAKITVDRRHHPDLDAHSSSGARPCPRFEVKGEARLACVPLERNGPREL
jgi:hypothetical protein